MKRILLYSMIALLIGATAGCLKDKGFDNYKYGINDPDNSPAGVGFPLAASGNLNVIGLNSFSGVAQVINDVIYVNLESGKPAPADIHLTIAVDNSLITAYKTASTDPAVIAKRSLITLLQTKYYKIGSLNLTIPAGQTSVQVPITVDSTKGLSLDSTYGVGIKIASVDAGYIIAANLSNLLVGFNLKNKYDGIYKLKGYHNRPTLDLPYNETVHMVTSGPNSVYMYWPALGQNAHPINGGATYYGSFTTNFIFDPVSDKMIAWDLTPYATTVVPSIQPSPPFPQSRYDAATKTIYAYYYYNNNPGARAFYDTLTYVGVR